MKKAKEILKDFGAPVSNGFVIFNPKELDKNLNIYINLTHLLLLLPEYLNFWQLSSQIL